MTLTKDPAPGILFELKSSEDVLKMASYSLNCGRELEKTHPSIPFQSQTGLCWSFPHSLDTQVRRRTPDAREELHRGDAASPCLCADGLGPSSPSPHFPFKIQDPNVIPSCLQVKRGGYKPSFKQPQESGCRFRLSRGAYQSQSLKTVLGIVQLSRFTTFLSPD